MIPPISTLSESVRNPQKKTKKEVQSSDHKSARCPRRASGCAETQSSFSPSVSDLHLNSNESGVKLHISAFVSGLKITQMFVTEPSPRIVSCWACFVGVGPRWRRSVQDLPVLKAKVWSAALTRSLRALQGCQKEPNAQWISATQRRLVILSVLFCLCSCCRFWIFYRFIWVA